MVTDHQVRILMTSIIKGNSFGLSAAKAGMDVKTASKYRDLNKLPSEIKRPVRMYMTRQSPFDGLWYFIYGLLDVNPGLHGRTILKHLILEYNGKEIEDSSGDTVVFDIGWNQLRTLQRGIKNWKATEGPCKEVYFSQIYHPGERSQSDFTHMDALEVTIGGLPFNHMIYHFVLPFSNWQACSICFSESFESLSDGLQDALQKLGGIPKSHQTDQLSAAVHHLDNPEEFTDRYTGLLNHYGLEGRKIQVGKPNENGDVEQSNHRFKVAVDQSLMLRGSRDFNSREDYALFIDQVITELNSGCTSRLREELKLLRRLPETKYDARKVFNVRVGQGSTISVNCNTYSVDSRLIGEKVRVIQYAEYLQVYYGQKLICELPRLIGRGKHDINYRHIIDSLVRKPGAFENYKYKTDLFPTSRFRIAYDLLLQQHSAIKAAKQYLKILYIAARENESEVDYVLGLLIDREISITFSSVKELVVSNTKHCACKNVDIDEIDLDSYDYLLT